MSRGTAFGVLVFIAIVGATLLVTRAVDQRYRAYRMLWFTACEKQVHLDECLKRWELLK